jgi:hypothetical protein
MKPLKMALGLLVGCLATAHTRSCSAQCEAGNGNVTMESDRPEKLSQQVSTLAVQHKFAVTSMNSYQDPRTGLSQAQVQLQGDLEAMPSLMTALGELGKIKNQSFNETNYGSPNMEKQVEELDREIEKLGAPLTKTPAILGLVAQHRQSLASQIQRTGEPGEKKACLYINIQEPGAEAASMPSPRKSIPFTWAALLLSTGIASGFIGFRLGRLSQR